MLPNGFDLIFLYSYGTGVLTLSNYSCSYKIMLSILLTVHEISQVYFVLTDHKSPGGLVLNKPYPIAQLYPSLSRYLACSGQQVKPAKDLPCSVTLDSPAHSDLGISAGRSHSRHWTLGM